MAAQRSKLNGTTIVVSVLTFFLLPAFAWAGPADTEAQTAADAMAHRVVDAWNRSDGAAYGENYWPEAELRYPIGNILRGRSAIIREHVNLWAGPFRGSHAGATVRGIQLLGSNRLLVDVDMVISWVHRAELDIPPNSTVVKTHLKDMLEKRKGVWKILSGQNTYTMAAAVATPVLGQTAPVGPANRAKQGAASLPDFSGIWGHLSLPPFEPPLAGPGPVTNRSHMNSERPDLGVIPFNEPLGNKSHLVSNIYALVGDYTNPILKPEAAEIVKEHGEISLKGVPYPTPSNQCWPGGVPYVFWNTGMQMLQQPGKITILYSNDQEVRHVRMNAQHPPRVTASWYGDSVGHYEGGTLVIDTVGFKKGPYAMLDMYGTPFSENLHVVERYRLIDYEAAKAAEGRSGREGFDFPLSDSGLARDSAYRGKGLQLEFTVEDKGVFTTPWSATMTYRRPLGAWPEMVCAENTHDYVGRTINLPQADTPDF